MRHIVLTLFCASCLVVAAAQEGGGFYMSPTQIRQLASASIDPSMMGTAKGCITSEAGRTRGGGQRDADRRRRLRKRVVRV